MAKHEPDEPREQTYTTWYNPLPHGQYVDLHMNGKLNRVKFAPGERKQVPSEFDYAIQRVVCADPECKAGTGFCMKGHAGQVIGGLAPQLVNETAEGEQVVHDDLNTQLAARREAEAKLAAAAVTTQAAQQTQMIAAMQLEQAKASAPAPASPSATSDAGAKPKK